VYFKPVAVGTASPTNRRCSIHLAARLYKLLHAEMPLILNRGGLDYQ
jgi:hypothetical protein